MYLLIFSALALQGSDCPTAADLGGLPCWTCFARSSQFSCRTIQPLHVSNELARRASSWNDGGTAAILAREVPVGRRNVDPHTLWPTIRV
jgi:hypothetical protein